MRYGCVLVAAVAICGSGMLEKGHLLFNFGLLCSHCTVGIPGGDLQKFRFAFFIRCGIRTLAVVNGKSKVPRFVPKLHQSRRVVRLHIPAVSRDKRSVGFNGAAIKAAQSHLVAG